MKKQTANENRLLTTFNNWLSPLISLIFIVIILVYAIRNRSAITPSGWFVVIAVVSALVLFAISQKKATGKKFPNIWIGYSTLAIGFLFIIYLAVNTPKIEPKDMAIIMLTFGLVLATFVGAYSSTRTVEEMKEQRYATALPVIDILAIDEMGRTASVQIAEAKAKSKGTRIVDEIAPLTHLTCLLRNIGIGPATDVFSFITVKTLNEVGSKEHCEFRRLGPLETGANLKDIGNERWHLFLMQRNGCKFLVIYYFDVYGRCFESIREVTRNETTGELKINPLKVKKIEDKEYELLIKGNYTNFVDKLWPTSKQEVIQ